MNEFTRAWHAFNIPIAHAGQLGLPLLELLLALLPLLRRPARQRGQEGIHVRSEPSLPVITFASLPVAPA